MLVVGILAAITLPFLQATDITDLPLEAKQKIDSRASLSTTGHLAGNLYNGNPDWTVTEVVINVSEPDWFPRAVEAHGKGLPVTSIEK
jgi:hypothetical protein